MATNTQKNSMIEPALALLTSGEYEIKNITTIRRGSGGISGYERFTVKPKVRAVTEAAIEGFGVTDDPFAIMGQASLARETLFFSAHDILQRLASDGTTRSVSEAARGDVFVVCTPMRFQARGSFAEGLNQLALSEQSQRTLETPHLSKALAAMIRKPENPIQSAR